MGDFSQDDIGNLSSNASAGGAASTNTGISGGLNNITPPSDFQGNSEISFVTIVIAIVISWILVALWTRSLENLFYIKLGFNGDSFWQTTLVALIVTILFFVLIWFVDSYELVSSRSSGTDEEIESFGSPIIGGLGGNPGTNFQNSQNGQDNQDERNTIFA